MCRQNARRVGEQGAKPARASRLDRRIGRGHARRRPMTVDMSAPSSPPGIDLQPGRPCSIRPGRTLMFGARFARLPRPDQPGASHGRRMPGPSRPSRRAWARPTSPNDGGPGHASPPTRHGPQAGPPEVEPSGQIRRLGSALAPSHPATDGSKGVFAHEANDNGPGRAHAVHPSWTAESGPSCAHRRKKGHPRAPIAPPNDGAPGCSRRSTRHQPASRVVRARAVLANRTGRIGPE